MTMGLSQFTKRSLVLKKLSRCRLCKQVTGAVFLAILIVEGAILIFSVHNFERDRLLEVEREGLAVVRAWLQISGDNPLTLNKMSPNIGNGSVLLSAEIMNEAGQEIASLSQYSILAPKMKSFDVQWTKDDLGYPLIVQAKLDKTEIPAQITAFIWRIIGLVLLISFFVTAVTMVILEWLMLSPIRHLRDRMNKAGIDLAHPEKYKINQIRRDELGDVALSYNDLLHRLSAAFSEIRVQQDNLQQNNAKLETLVSDRTRELKSVVRDLRREAVERERAEKALDASNGQFNAEYLKKIAYTDTLTGLANRGLFMDRCHQLIRQIKRSEETSAVHLIDLDGFNGINQNYGQAVGDLVLQSVADRLGELVRDSDTLARLSADEFALIQLDVADSDEAAILAQRIMDHVSQPIKSGDDVIDLTCSIGITLLNIGDETPEDVLHHVTLAKRRAKQQSGSSYQFYVEELNRQAIERRAIERDLKQAIPNGELELYYQPKLDVERGTVSGMEALIRWNHPERGFVSPAQFIPIAERSSLIVSIGDWVLREATRQARRWQADGLGDLKVAVNVSAVQLKEICMVTLVRQVLLESGLSPHLLELEITESAVMDDVEHTISVLEELRDLGVSLSIDDFGTGYSSLNYIKRFPVKRIKIDKAFIDEIVDETSDGVIAKAVITMGHSMGMEITAEGVEDAFQQAFLSNHGVDEIQGYLFAKPLNAKEFEAFVSAQSKAQMAAE
ncbi:MAG: EAL domain-containing protein [Methylocystaceae bacterium]|nr:EAL domain-containing protein [Methylocystaceae bacterium]